MAQRIPVTNGEAIVEPTRLLSEFLMKNGKFAMVEETLGEIIKQAPSNGSTPHRLDDLIDVINELKEGWAALHSEQLVARLEPAFSNAGEGSNEVSSSTQPELWLVKALALEKSVITGDLAEAEKYYSKCRGSLFQTVIVLNNSGVLQAKRDNCGAALDLFKDAMVWASKMNGLVKAPFYNFALIVAHLYRQRFIFDPDYLRILDDVVDALPFLERFRKGDDIENVGAESAQVSRKDEEIRELCEAIARYSHDILEPHENDFYRSALTVVVPGTDLPGSFGDTPDKVDRETASEVFSDGRELFDQKLFAESIRSFEFASSLASDFSRRASDEIERVSDSWRFHENQIILKLAQNKEFDKAVTRLRNLPDKRLERQSDEVLVEIIKKQKQVWLLRDADELANKGQLDEAKLKYKLLLREDLSDQLRKHISTRLAALLELDGPIVREDRQD